MKTYSVEESTRLLKLTNAELVRVNEGWVGLTPEERKARRPRQKLLEGLIPKLQRLAKPLALTRVVAGFDGADEFSPEELDWLNQLSPVNGEER